VIGNDHMHELVEAYALRALEPDEVRVFEAHLVECAACRRALSDLEETLAALPDALSDASPMRLHPAVKRRVMRSLDRPKKRWIDQRSWWAGVAASAALLLLLASVAWNIQLSSALAHQRTVQAELVGKITHDQATVFDVVDSPGTTKRVLRSATDSGPGAPYGKLFTRSDSADVVAMVNRMPQPPAGQSYNLYLTGADDSITSAGALPVDAEGFSYLVYHSDRAGPVFTHVEVRLGLQTILTWNGTR